MRAVVALAGARRGARLTELAEPGQPGPGQLLVRMKLAAVNPADLMVVAGAYGMEPEAGTPIGAEGMGVIEMAGPGVMLPPGRRVMIATRGNWAERRLVNVDEATPVPDILPDEQAAVLRINPATAWWMLERLNLRAGDHIVQNAGGSSVARWVRLIAEVRGLRVIDVVRRPVEALPEAMIDGEDLAERVRARAGPARAALDAVAGEASGRMAACLAMRGEMIVHGHLSGEPCRIPSMLLTTRGLRIRGFSLRSAEPGDRRIRDRLYARLAQMAATAPEPIHAIFPLAAVDRAMAAMSDPGRRGRILLDLAG